MWNNYLKITIRNLIKYRSFNLVNILGLSIAIAIFIAIVLYIQFEISFDKFHVNADRIYRIEQIMNEAGRIEQMAGCPTPLWQVLENDFPEVEASIRVVDSEIQLTAEDGNSIRAQAFFVEDVFLQAFSFQLLEGNPNDALAEPMSAVLTRETAHKLFGDEEVVGKSYEANNILFKITGVLEDVPKNSHLQFDALLSINTLHKLYGDDTFTHWGDNWVCLYVILKPEHQIEKFRSGIKSILKKYFYEETLNELDARPMDEIHLYANISHEYAFTGSIRNVYIMMAIAFFIMFMAGVNFTNLSVAYSSIRSKEVSMRKILGGTRRLLLTQFLGESMVLTFISLFLGFVIFETILPLFNNLVNRELDFNYFQNVPLILIIVIIAVILGLLSAIYPAILISGFKPITVFRTGITGGSRNPYLRKLLVVFQFLVSAALIVGTIGVVRQAYYMKNKDLGYNPHQVVRIFFQDSSMVRINTLREEILRNPHILNASVHDYPVCNSENWTRVAWEGSQEGEYIRINVNYTDHHYLDTYEMRLITGDGFTKPQQGSSDEGNEVILNRAAVKRIGFEDPIGKKILYWGDYKTTNIRSATIVGIVEDFHFLSVHNLITPLMIRLFNENMVGRSFSIRLDGLENKSSLGFIEEQFAEIFPDQPFEYEFVEDFHARMYGEEDKLAKVVFFLSILAIVIACLGVYGLVAFITSRRMQEVGIRKVMGAGYLNISKLFTREFMGLIILSNLVAWPIAYFLVKNWLQSFPYQVGFSLIPYLVALLLTLLFTQLSMLYHTYRISGINPAESLRYE